MENIIQEFKVIFGVDNKPLEKGLNQSQNTLNKFGKWLGAFAATYMSINIFQNIINDYVNFNNTLRQSIELTGGNVESISAMGGALKRFGGDTQSVTNALKSMQNHLREAKRGGGALIDIAYKYGVSINAYQSADKALESLIKKTQGYSKETKIAIAQQLGLDEAMQRALLNAEAFNAEIEKQKTLGVITESDLKISQDFQNALLDLKDIFGAITRDLARLVVPVFKNIVDLFYKFIEFCRKHKQLVVGFFIALTIAMSPLLIMFAKMAIASAAAFAPIYAVVGVITAIALIFEDLYYYANGWDSATGELVKKFPALKPLMDSIAKIVVEIYETFYSIIEFLKNPSWDNFLNIFKKLGNILASLVVKPFEMIKAIVQWLSDKFPALAGLLKPVISVIDYILDAFKQVRDIINSLSVDGIINGVKDLGQSVSNFTSNAIDKINPLNWFGNDKENQAALNAPLLPTQNQVTNSNVSNSNTTNNNYTINNKFNQNISSATPVELANSTNKQIINSINQQRQQQGSL